jgi:hypothetical protein
VRLTGREAFRVSGMGGGEQCRSRCDALLGPLVTHVKRCQQAEAGRRGGRW